MIQEFDEALQEVAERAKEAPDFEARFSKMIKNYMSGMSDLANIHDVIQDTVILGVKDEN